MLHGKPKLSDTIAVPPKTVITILPAISASPTTGLLLGVSGNAVARLGADESTNLSTVSASVNYTTKKQFNILLRSNMYTSANAWKLEGDWRYLDSNQPTYGLGPALPGEFESPMDYNLIRFYETVYRGISRNFLVGLGYHLNRYFKIVDHNADAGIVTPYVQYSGGQPTSSTSSGLSFNVLSDSRDNPLNTRNGLLARGSLRFSPTWLGSDDNWQSFEAELRTYHQMGRERRRARLLGAGLVHHGPASLPRSAGYRMGLQQPERTGVRPGKNPGPGSGVRRSGISDGAVSRWPVRRGGVPQPYVQQ